MQNGLRPYGSKATNPQWGFRHAQGHRYWLFIHLFSAPGSPEHHPSPVLPQVPEAERLRHLEAVLFLSPEGISSRKAAKLAGLADATEARTLIRQLNLVYDQSGRPYRVEEVAGGFAILTRSHFAPWIRRLSYIPGEIRLGQSALETLAIVAYRQPVLRANIEAIRGVGCSEVLKQLMELDLVRISGRSEDLGRPYLYGTTRRFLQMFGLRSADRLPRIDWVNDFASTQIDSSTEEFAATDSEAKESTVKKSFIATALLDDENVDATLLSGQVVPVAAVDGDDDDFYDDDDDDDEEDDDLEEDDDFEEWDDEDDAEEDDAEDADDVTEEDSEWEEVDDDDDLEEDEEEKTDDTEDDDEWDDDDDDDDWEDEDEDEEWD